MKFIYLILSLIILISCKDDHESIHEEMDKISNELRKFDIQLIELYKESENNPKGVITKADSFLIANRKVKDKYKSQIKSNVESSLHYLKAELYYKIGKYDESIHELDFEEYKKGSAAIAYAANYVKLKDFQTAKKFIDSIGSWNGDYYALGNYYE